MIETLGIIPEPSLAFLPFLIPALIGGAATVASTVIANKNAKKQAQRQTAANQQQAQQQFVFDEKMMDKQNAFNKAQAAQQYKNDMAAMELQRKWDLEDRAHAAANPTTVKTEVDFEAMKASAEKAGFNPLTVLRNGGSAGFSASSQPSAPLSRTAPVMQAPHQGVARQMAAATVVPDYQSPWAAGIGAGVGYFLDHFDPFQDQKRELEFGLVQAQIANLNASTRAMDRPQSFNVPTYTARNREQRPSGTAGQLSQPLPARFGQSVTPTVEAPTVTNPWPTSWGAMVNPNVPDGASFEDRYGEVGGSALGLGVLLGDGVHNAPQLWNGVKSWLRNVPSPPTWLGGSGKAGRLN